MYLKYLLVLVLYSVATLVECNDIMLGNATPYSKKIYSAVKIADPALWRREDDIMVSTPNHELIDAVYITDLRPDKEGEAYIEAGGIGSKTVTIALKSPSILRGYKFAVEVYAQNIHSGYPSSFLPVNQGYTRGGLSGYQNGGQYVNAYSSVGNPTGSIYPRYKK